MDNPWLEVIKNYEVKRLQVEEDLRDVIVLAVRQGVSYADIAKVLGISRQAVRQKYGASAKEDDVQES